MENTMNNLDQKISEIADVAKKELAEIAASEVSSVSRNLKEDKFENLLEKFYEAQTVLLRTKEKLVDHGKLVIEKFETETAEAENKEPFLEKLREIVTSEIIRLVQEAMVSRLK